MHVLQQPAPIRLALRGDEVECLSHTLVRSNLRAAQILKPTQNVVVIASRERELSPVRIDHFSGGETVQQAALEEVLLSPLARRRHCWRVACSSLVLQES